MTWFFRKRDRRIAASARRWFRPMLECLEDRTVPATIDIGAGDVQGLINAINTANSNGQSNTIELGGGTYDLTAADNYWYGPNGLPAITSNLIIDGGSNGATIQRDSSDGTPAFRFFYVSGGLAGELPMGTLVLHDLTLENGLAQGGSSNLGGGGLGAGGAIFNQGSLTLDSVTLTKNDAVGGNSGDTALGSNAGGGGGMGGNADANGDGGGFGGSVANSAGLGGRGSGSGAGGGGGGFTTGAIGSAGNGDTGGGGGGGGGFGGGVGDGGSGGGNSGKGYDGGSGGDFGNGGLAGNSFNQDTAASAGGGGGVGGGGGAEVGFGGGGNLGALVADGGDGGFGGGGGNSGGNSQSGSPFVAPGAGGFGGGAAAGGNAINGGPAGFGGGDGAAGGTGVYFGGGGAGMGGAVFNMGASNVVGSGAVFVVDSTLTGNEADGGRGGGPGAGNGSGFGGAFFNLDGSLTLDDDTIDGNLAQSGFGFSLGGNNAAPAVAASGAAVGSNNAALGAADGGAVYNLAFGNVIQTGGPTTASLTINNSILADSVEGADLGGSIINGVNANNASIGGSNNLITNQDVSNFTPANGFITATASPGLGPLQNNGGLTSTMADAPGSSAFGAGAPSALPAGLTSDQNGDPRVTAQGLDIGAYQYQLIAPAIVTQPTDQTVDAGQTVTFTASATGSPAPTVNWAVDTVGLGDFNDLSNGGNVTITTNTQNGVTTSTLTLTSVQLAQNGYHYEAFFNNSANTAITNVVTLTVDAAPAITTQPSNETGNAGGTATFMASATGNPTPTVGWQVSSDGGKTFTPVTSGVVTTTINGVTTSTLTLNDLQTSQAGQQYQAVFTNSVGAVITNAATLTINTVQAAPVITTNPSNQNLIEDQTATFTAAASGNPTTTVQWQVSSDGGQTFNAVSNGNISTTPNTVTTSTLTLNIVDASENGNEYRAVFTNSLGSATTSAATLTVDSGPTITIQPSSQTVDAGQTVTFTAAASGTSAPPTVRWIITNLSQYVTTQGTITTTTLGNVTTSTLTLNNVTTDLNDYGYVARFSDGIVSTDTNTAVLTVTPPRNRIPPPQEPQPAPGQPPMGFPFLDFIFEAEDQLVLVVDTVAGLVFRNNPSLAHVADDLVTHLNSAIHVDNPALGSGTDGLQSAIEHSPLSGTVLDTAAQVTGFHMAVSLFA